MTITRPIRLLSNEPLVHVSSVFLEGKAAVPTIFILGDSTADVGTNNFLPGSMARADFPYNGIDFLNSTPTGRFSNGLNTADLVTKQFGYERSPKPFLSLNTTSLQKWFGASALLLEGLAFLIPLDKERRKIVSH
ncbi:hypothetical protein M0R45_009869 [Rubus argutus]|uniref:GDSL esterase/lipase n=1 Tax=Rubus argutus TaxID=59490 RepID=A0AAW1Y5D4_RUBAR